MGNPAGSATDSLLPPNEGAESAAIVTGRGRTGALGNASDLGSKERGGEVMEAASAGVGEATVSDKAGTAAWRSELGGSITRTEGPEVLDCSLASTALTSLNGGRRKK